MAMNMVDEGTASRSSLQISEELAGLGAEFRSGSGLDVCTVSLSALKDRLGPSLDIMADVVLRPSFPDKELERLRQTTLARIQQEKAQPIGLALRVLPGPSRPGHAYGQPLTGSGTEASVKAMTRDDLVRFHQAWFKPNAATLVVVGDITMAELRPHLDRAFARWARARFGRKNVATVAGREAQRHLRDGSARGRAVADFEPPNSSPQRPIPTRWRSRCSTTGSGGAFSARVNMNLREDKHWSYGAYSFAFDARGQRPWIVYAPVQTDKTKETVQEILRELREATGSRPLTAAEVADARDRQTLTLAGRWETADAVSASLQEQFTFGLPADYWQTYAARARAVTPEQATGAAKKNFDPSKMVWVVVGDRAKIESGLRELNMGEIRYLDGDGRPAGSAK